MVEEHDGVELAGLGGPVQPGPLLQQAEAGRVAGLHRVAEGELRHQLLQSQTYTALMSPSIACVTCGGMSTALKGMESQSCSHRCCGVGRGTRYSPGSRAWLLKGFL